MAKLPQRVTLNKFFKNNSPLHTLLQLGFPKHRAEKALTCTGNQSVQSASDWLLAHVNDPTLDDRTPREYILYACPKGTLEEVLGEFWSKSKKTCGWNGAHNFIPHITLVSFFKASDECAPYLTDSLKNVVDMIETETKDSLKLELYISQNFIGYFVGESDTKYLQKVALQYVKEISNIIINDTYEQFDAIIACFPWCSSISESGNRCITQNNKSITMEPYVKSLHMTLAYQFQHKHFDTLKSMVQDIDPKIPSDWELRLYSRDSRLGTKEVQKVLFPYKPIEDDELVLRLGDFIYVNGDQIDSSVDGWVEGISWLTGMTGYLPQNFIERTAESDAWTLHKTVPLYSTSSIAPLKSEDFCNKEKPDNRNFLAPKRNLFSKNDPLRNLADSNETFESKCIENHSNIFVKNSKLNQTMSEISGFENTKKDPEIISRRTIYLMRHGERVDFTFGIWAPYCFDEFNIYVRKDLNMPKFLPKRKNCPECWQNDSPLTNIGTYQALLTGEAINESNVKIDNVYCSPSYRCIETCSTVLDGMKLKESVPIKIEPGFFEWMAWYPKGSPDFCTTEELRAANYNIDQNYNSIIKENTLQCYIKETSGEFYLRNFRVLQEIIKNTTGNILIVAHAATLETCTRQLTGKKDRPTEELRHVIQKIPYCCLISVENTNEKWLIKEPLCLPITHLKNSRFEWHLLNTT